MREEARLERGIPLVGEGARGKSRVAQGLEGVARNKDCKEGQGEHGTHMRCCALLRDGLTAILVFAGRASGVNSVPSMLGLLRRYRWLLRLQRRNKVE